MKVSNAQNKQASPQEFNPNKSDAIKSINSQTPSLHTDNSYQRDNLVSQLQQFFQLSLNHQSLNNIIQNHCIDPETLLLLIQKSKYDLVLLIVLQTINEYFDENRKSRTTQYEVPKTQTTDSNKQPQYMQYMQILQRNMATVIHDNFSSLRLRNSQLSSFNGTTTDYVSEHWIDQRMEPEDLQSNHLVKNVQEFHQELDTKPNPQRFRENKQNYHQTQGSYQFSYLEFPKENKRSSPQQAQSMTQFYQPSQYDRKQSMIQIQPRQDRSDYDSLKTIRQTEPDLLLRKETANFQNQYEQDSPKQKDKKQITRVTEDHLESRKSSAPSLKNKDQSPSRKQSNPLNRPSRSPKPFEQIYNNMSVKSSNKIPISKILSIDNVSRKKKSTQNDSKILFDILRHDKSSEYNKSIERRNEVSQ